MGFTLLHLTSEIISYEGNRGCFIFNGNTISSYLQTEDAHGELDELLNSQTSFKIQFLINVECFAESFHLTTSSDVFGFISVAPYFRQ